MAKQRVERGRKKSLKSETELRLRTRKRDRHNHGFGLENLQERVDKNCGKVKKSAENGDLS